MNPPVSPSHCGSPRLNISETKIYQHQHSCLVVQLQEKQQLGLDLHIFSIYLCMYSLGFHAGLFCQQFIVLFRAGVGQQLSTLQQIFSPKQSSRAVPWLWLLTTAYFSAVLQRAHPRPGVPSHRLSITQLLSARVRPTL